MRQVLAEKIIERVQLGLTVSLDSLKEAMELLAISEINVESLGLTITRNEQ